ncbi:MAG: 4Fe-4S dicluster domain-containing protein [Proteobacteria bacterium]|nr:4Fe-4S dicluster domain-containing protein [Pseudomonadota bacterium]
MTRIGFYFDQTRCTGCYTCVVACKDWHDVEAGPVNWMRIRTMESGRFPDLFVAYLALACCHCENPPCATVCPTGAIVKNPDTGVVTVDQQACPGNQDCHAPCLKVCPWDAPQFGPQPGARMEKCDLCQDRLMAGQAPVCVEACPMYALDVGPLEELRARYGGTDKAEGFIPGERFGPSVVFRPKLRPVRSDG